MVASVKVSIGMSFVVFVNGSDSTAVSWGFLSNNTHVRESFTGRVRCRRTRLSTSSSLVDRIQR